MLPILFADSFQRFWYLFPLLVAISFVYAATREELMRPILHKAGAVALWILGFMAIIFAILFGVSWLI